MSSINDLVSISINEEELPPEIVKKIQMGEIKHNPFPGLKQAVSPENLSNKAGQAVHKVGQMVDKAGNYIGTAASKVGDTLQAARVSPDVLRGAASGLALGYLTHKLIKNRQQN